MGVNGGLQSEKSGLTVDLKEYLLYVNRHLGVVSEEATNEVVSQELVIVDHLDEVDVEVECHFDLVDVMLLTENCRLLLEGCLKVISHTQQYLIKYEVSFLLLKEGFQFLDELEFGFGNGLLF